MSTEIPAASRNGRFRKDLDREAVDLALKGEWDRAVEVNRAILELFADDVEAMNRLAKALIELGSYEEAGGVLDRVCTIAPYNNIARKNRARVEQMKGSSAVATRQARKHAGAPQLFIGESGKSATTTSATRPVRCRWPSPLPETRCPWSLSITASVCMPTMASTSGRSTPVWVRA